LTLIEALYAGGVAFKNALYDFGALVPDRADVPVVAIGNLTVGGSGKTPFTRLLAERLRAQGKRVGVLSRGYGVDIAGGVMVVSDGTTLAPPPPVSPDEAYLLARALPGVPVVCSPKRIVGARRLTDDFAVDVILLDDAFQHRAIHRDLNVLLVDVENPFGPTGRLAPRGTLREPPEAARRADLIVFTGTAPMEPTTLAAARSLLAAVAPATPVTAAAGNVAGFADLKGRPYPTPSGPVAAFCGVANPERFHASLCALNLAVALFDAFPDHHPFTADEIDRLVAAARRAGVAAIVVTEKDMVRLIRYADRLAGVPIVAARYEMRLLDKSGPATALTGSAPR
jgi:tetraacyldisaccharide 4'-kinase